MGLIVSKSFYNHECSINNIIHHSLFLFNEYQKEEVALWTKADQSYQAIQRMLRQENPSLNICLSDFYLYNIQLYICYIVLIKQIFI